MEEELARVVETARRKAAVGRWFVEAQPVDGPPAPPDAIALYWGLLQVAERQLAEAQAAARVAGATERRVALATIEGQRLGEAEPR